jgi:hypothetical protein
MKKKYIIIEDINSTEDGEHIVLENDVFIDDDEPTNSCCCCGTDVMTRLFRLISFYLD